MKSSTVPGKVEWEPNTLKGLSSNLDLPESDTIR